MRRSLHRFNAASIDASPGPKMVAETPVRLHAYDLLEGDGKDLRGLPWLDAARVLESCSRRWRRPALAAKSSRHDWERLPRAREERAIAASKA